MGVRKFRPTTPSRRHMTGADFSDLTKKKPEKRLCEPKPSTGGRNSRGRITNRGRGGGTKKRYRRIDFKRNKDGIPARVAAIEYDPNRTCRIALLAYADGEKRYIPCPDGLEPGRTVMSGPGAEPDVGNCLPLEEIPQGMPVHNIELHPGRGGQLARAAGTSARVMAVEKGYAHVVLPSGEVRMIKANCRATIGQVGNLDHQKVSYGKAGKTRWKGRRPITRGIARNPCDHPMGGGEGRSKGNIPTSPTGVLAKGGKTRRPRNPTNRFIVRRRKS